MHRRVSTLLIGGLLVVSGSTCSQDIIGVGVSVKNLAPEVSSLFVYSVLNGGVQKQSARFSQQLNHFTIQVPIGLLVDGGQLTIFGSGLANDRCKLSTGRTDLTLRTDSPYTESELNLVTLPSKLCTQLSQVTPAVGPSVGGIPLTLDGQNFSDGTTVTIDGLPATSVQVISPTRLTAVLPATPGAFGKVPVVVQTPEGASASRSDLFAYYQLSFQSTSYAAGKNPSSITTGDFNRDGKRDVVVGNYQGGNVSVLLGDGIGTLGAGINSNSATGSCPRAISTGDFNQDGVPDLAVANECSNNVSVMFGTGSGTFSMRTESSIDTNSGTVPNSIVVGDLSGDGKVDLAVTNLNGKNVGVLIGNGAGGFGGVINISVSASPMGLALGDFNTDGKSDLAVSLFGSNSVSVLHGVGTGSFNVTGTYAVNSKPDFVAVADFNSDGKADLAVANNGTTLVSILLGSGDGIFGVAKSFTVGNTPYSIVVGDFNGDTRSDLAVANYGSNNVSILIGDGIGGFSVPTNFPVGLNPQSVAAGDFTSDGKLDLVVANGGDNTVTLLTNLSK